MWVLALDFERMKLESDGMAFREIKIEALLSSTSASEDSGAY
jgi:hypothetical protein